MLVFLEIETLKTYKS